MGTTVKEKDLGVTISADMKVSEQIQRKKLIIPFYKPIVRPHLEYCIKA